MFRKPLRYLYIILYTSCTFQTFTMPSKIEFMPLLSLECFYACLGSPLGTYVSSLTYLAHISHRSLTFQTFTMPFKIEFMSLLSFLECFYTCLGSLLSTYVLSRTYLAHISHIPNSIRKSNFYIS